MPGTLERGRGRRHCSCSQTVYDSSSLWFDVGQRTLNLNTWVVVGALPPYQPGNTGQLIWTFRTLIFSFLENGMMPLALPELEGFCEDQGR